MRFNKQELMTLANQPSHKFDKEGVLYLRERQDGFFKRNERKSISHLPRVYPNNLYTYLCINTFINMYILCFTPYQFM